MKKRFSLLGVLAIAGIAGITLASCSGDRIEKKDLYSATGIGPVSKFGSGEVLFKKGSDIPYMSLDSGVDFMTLVRSANLDSLKYKYELKKDGNDYIITNERGAKCTINESKQTLVFDEYDAFSSLVTESQKPLSLITIKDSTKALKMNSSDYVQGNTVTVDLKPYSKLDIITRNDKCFLPLSVFNSVLYNTFENVNIAYNGNDLFLVPGSSLSMLGEQTSLGVAFHTNAAKDSISQEMAEYNYQSICFDFDYEYGLKGSTKSGFKSFDEFLTQKGFKDKLLTTNPKDIDINLAYALSYLNDGHTTFAEFSNLYAYGDHREVDNSKFNPDKVAWETADEKYQKSHKDAGITQGLEYKGDTVFVTFKEFTSINNELLYDTSTDSTDDSDDFLGGDEVPGLDFGLLEDPKNGDTACIFSRLYKDLNTPVYKNRIKNIVVDLSANDGGAADALLYSLSTLIGDVAIDISNPLTGAHNHQVYKADMNADGKIDENDKSLYDLGFKIYFLDSKYSFSSANAMPVIAKLNKPDVVTIGDTTAGGPCAVRYYVTPIGSAYNASSLSTISKVVDNKYVDIDDGVKADFALTEEQMINREYIVQNIKNWTK